MIADIKSLSLIQPYFSNVLIAHLTQPQPFNHITHNHLDTIVSKIGHSNTSHSASNNILSSEVTSLAALLIIAFGTSQLITLELTFFIHTIGLLTKKFAALLFFTTFAKFNTALAVYGLAAVIAAAPFNGIVVNPAHTILAHTFKLISSKLFHIKCAYLLTHVYHDKVISFVSLASFSAKSRHTISSLAHFILAIPTDKAHANN